MADDFTIGRGDLLPSLEATLTPAPGQSFTLTGCTVHFRMWAKSDGADKVYAVCTIVDATARTVRYDWQAGDTDVAGGYLARFEVTFPGGSVQRFPNDRARVVRVSP